METKLLLLALADGREVPELGWISEVDMIMTLHLANEVLPSMDRGPKYLLKKTVSCRLA